MPTSSSPSAGDTYVKGTTAAFACNAAQARTVRALELELLGLELITSTIQSNRRQTDGLKSVATYTV